MSQDLDIDLSSDEQIQSLIKKYGDDLKPIQQSHLSVEEFKSISGRLRLDFTQDIDTIYSRLQECFKYQNIIIVDQLLLNRSVEIKSVGAFVDGLLSAVSDALDDDIASSLKRLFKFIINECIHSTTSNNNTHDNVFKLRFPVRKEGCIYILLFKLKIIRIKEHRRLAFFMRRRYTATIQCLNTLFYVDEL